jgi:hypothetical protein
MRAGLLDLGFCIIPVASSQVAASKRAGEVSSLLFVLGAARHLEPEKHSDPLSEGRACPVVDDEALRHGTPVKLWSGVGQVLGATAIPTRGVTGSPIILPFYSMCIWLETSALFVGHAVSFAWA